MKKITEERYERYLQTLGPIQQDIMAVFRRVGEEKPLTITHILDSVNTNRYAWDFIGETSISPRIRELDERGLGLIRECTSADDRHLGTIKGKVRGKARQQRAWVWRGNVRPDYRPEKDYHDLFIRERAARQRLVRAKNL